MKKTHLVRLEVTNYYDIEVDAPDDLHIFEFKDPTYARHLSRKDLDKLRNPDYHISPNAKERITRIVDVVEPMPWTDEEVKEGEF